MTSTSHELLTASSATAVTAGSGPRREQGTHAGAAACLAPLPISTWPSHSHLGRPVGISSWRRWRPNWRGSPGSGKCRARRVALWPLPSPLFPARFWARALRHWPRAKKKPRPHACGTHACGCRPSPRAMPIRTSTMSTQDAVASGLASHHIIPDSECPHLIGHVGMIGLGRRHRRPAKCRGT